MFWAHAALVAPLVLLNPVFGLYAFFGYVDSSRLLRGREATLGLVVTAALCAMAQTGGLASPLFTPLFLGLFLVVNLVIAGSMSRADRHRQARADELEQTNAELAREQARSAELQAQFVAQAHETGIAEERARLAREIHDTVAQDLVGIIA